MKQLFRYRPSQQSLSPLAKHNLYHLRGYYFFRALIFGYVIERLYWATKGISIGDTVILEMIYAIVLTGFEIPSGIWADRFGRKQLIVVSAMLAFVSNTLLLVGSGFGAFALAMVISASYGAFSSGSTNALLFDSLKMAGEESHFASCLASLKKWKLTSYMIAALGGSFMASQFNMTLNYQLSLLSCLAALYCAVQLKEPSIKSPSEEEQMHWSTTYWVATLQLFKNKAVLLPLLGGLVTGASIIYIDEFWQNYCQLIPAPLALFGFISLSFGGIQALASHLLERWGEQAWWQTFMQKWLGIICLIYGLIFVTLGFTPTWWGLVAMLFAYTLYTGIDLVSIDRLHHHTRSEVRAGVESAYSMLLRLASIGFGLVFGTSDQLSVTLGYTKLGIGIIIIGLIMILMQLNYSQMTKELTHEQHRQTQSAR